MRQLIILLAALFLIQGLSGCKSTTVIREPIEIERPVYHPQWPEPVTAYKPRWYVLTHETMQEQPDNSVFQALEWDQGQEFAIWLNTIQSYIRQLQAMVCQYRQERDEPICERYDVVDIPKLQINDSEE